MANSSGPLFRIALSGYQPVGREWRSGIVRETQRGCGGEKGGIGNCGEAEICLWAGRSWSARIGVAAIHLIGMFVGSLISTPWSHKNGQCVSWVLLLHQITTECRIYLHSAKMTWKSRLFTLSLSTPFRMSCYIILDDLTQNLIDVNI